MKRIQLKPEFRARGKAKGDHLQEVWGTILPPTPEQYVLALSRVPDSQMYLGTEIAQVLYGIDKGLAEDLLEHIREKKRWESATGVVT